MSLLFAAQMRLLFRNRWTTASLLFGLLLGVTSVVAVHLISLRIENAIWRLAAPQAAGMTHLLTRPGLTPEDYFDLRDAWRAGRHESIDGMAPVLERSAASSLGAVTVVASDWLADLTPQSTASAVGAAPGEVLLGESLGEAGSITVAGHTLTVSGRVPGDRVLMDLSTADRVFGPPSALTYVAVRIRTDTTWRDLADRLLPGVASVWPDAVVDPGLESPWQVTPINAGQPAVQFGRSVLFNLSALGLLALVVAWLLLYQVAVIWLAQRRPLMARLTAMGVGEPRLAAHFVATFVVIGAIASVLAIPLGAWLADALVAGNEVPVQGGIAVTRTDLVWVAGKALASGMVVAGCAAGLALRARPRTSGYSLAVGVGVPIVGITLVWWLGEGVVAGFAMVALLCWLTGGVAGGLLAGAAVLDRPGHARLVRWLGVRDVRRHRRDLTVALVALALAVATAIAMNLMVASFRADFRVMLEQRLSDDVYVRGAARLDDLPVRLEQAWPGVSVHSSGVRQLRIAGRAVELTYTDLDAVAVARYGDFVVRDAHDVLINSQAARTFGLEPGDPLKAAIGSGQDFRVAGVFQGFGDPGPRVVADAAWIPEPQRHFDRLGIGGVDPGTTRALVSWIRAVDDGLEIEARSSIRQMALSVFDRTFEITRALTLVALMVGALGIYNALVMVRLNQAPVTRLYGVLGLSRLEVAGVQLARSLTVGVMAVLLALPLGVAMAWVLCGWINPAAFGWEVGLGLDPVSLAVPVGLGLVASLAAALVPLPGAWTGAALPAPGAPVAALGDERSLGLGS